MNRSKLLSVVGIVVLAVLVITTPIEKKDTAGESFTDILYAMGERQEEYSDEVTADLVSGVEEHLTGEHKIDGSNWSIPNIIRHLLGVD